MNRRSYAMKLGGRHLVRSLLRFHPSRIYMPHGLVEVKDIPSVSKSKDLLKKSDATPSDSWWNEELPEFFTKPVQDLTDEDRGIIQSLFRTSVNMPASLLRRWADDPRMLDGIDPQAVYYRRARKRLLQLAKLKATSSEWTPADYEAARQAVFAVKAMKHPYTVDYELWATLRNFGYDWGRYIRSMPTRRLPVLVELEAETRLAAYRAFGRQPTFGPTTLQE